MALAISPPASVHCTERMIEASAIHTATAAEATDQRAVALRQHDIGQAQKDCRGVDRQACERAFGDEGRIMIEREEYVGRPRRYRQRRDQSRTTRSLPLGDDGGRHHERRGDRHAQAERKDEGEFGGHSNRSPLRTQGPDTPSA